MQLMQRGRMLSPTTTTSPASTQPLWTSECQLWFHVRNRKQQQKAAAWAVAYACLQGCWNKLLSLPCVLTAAPFLLLLLLPCSGMWRSTSSTQLCWPSLVSCQLPSAVWRCRHSCRRVTGGCWLTCSRVSSWLSGTSPAAGATHTLHKRCDRTGQGLGVWFRDGWREAGRYQQQRSGRSVLGPVLAFPEFAWRVPPTVMLLLHLGVQVVELEGVFQLLRGDVERLFLQAPCVDLDALGQQLAEAEGLVEEQGSIVQVCDVYGRV